MPRIGSPGSSRLRQLGLEGRMVAGVVGVIVLTAVAAGLPAYALVRSELERQAWARVEQGEAASRALVQAELDRLSDLAVLTAERPTLRALLEAGRYADLQAYIAAFQGSAGLDALAIVSPTGEVLAGDIGPKPQAGPLPEGASVVPAEDPDVWAMLAASAPILDSTGEDQLATVLVARDLDDGWLGDLGAQTGLDHSLVVGGIRRATTIVGAAGTPAPEAPRERDQVAGRPYDSTLILVGGPESHIELEVALPVEGILREERRALLALGTSTAIVAAAAALLGLILSRAITRPLDRLTEAARRISGGDLDTPVPMPAGPPEIALLAASLEESRATTLQTLETLSRQKAWLETLLQSIVEGIVTLDGQGLITTFSPGAERLTGWRASEAVGRPANVIFRTPDGAPFLDRLPRPGDRRPVQVVDRRGQTLTLSITDAKMRPPEESEVHLALVLRDVSEDEAVRQLRSYFLANISHEFRTPLSAIRASVDLLLEDLAGLSRNEIAELLRSVYLSVTGLQTLIDNLLESLSIEAGRFTIRRVPSDLTRVIGQSVQVMRPLLERREQSLELVLPASLRPVWMDPMRVGQVVVNLLSNASKYSPVRRPISLEVEAGEERVVVRVSDRGDGIDPQDRDNLFRRFVRLEPSDPGQYGVGLGLSVVKAIVEEHGGQVGVADRPGGGSIFWFQLPFHEEPS